MFRIRYEVRQDNKTDGVAPLGSIMSDFVPCVGNKIEIDQNNSDDESIFEVTDLVYSFSSNFNKYVPCIYLKRI